ncbi:hypothetical protein NP493_2110g00010 [Ridgeia piscesae]|uniref:Receptor ligand binding region domain-containing protein n=1 Tax=Ridgeia piscesae TaxID=27915 RepID=A0AAD9JL54_RIDPI|nr:hypothetical protein NP493_2110g00010 [Ridgeia piscesae]
MLAAHELGYINGEYVFMDVELFPFKGDYWGDHGWYRGDADDAKARVAYEALLRIGLYESKSPLFDEFSRELKRRALVEYGFDYGEEKVNFFAGAFRDAVHLYGIALNETLEAGEDPTDGHTFTHTMWNRNFVGVTDKVFIDDNGDRKTSFTVYDMNPDNGQFEPVAYYWGHNAGYSPVTGKWIHWPGGATSAPPDEPYCGFTHEKQRCVDKGIVPEALYPCAVRVLFRCPNKVMLQKDNLSNTM